MGLQMQMVLIDTDIRSTSLHKKCVLLLTPVIKICRNDVMLKDKTTKNKTIVYIKWNIRFLLLWLNLIFKLFVDQVF